MSFQTIFYIMHGWFNQDKVERVHIDQGGIFPGSQGAKLPQNLQTLTKFLQHFALFWHKFPVKCRNSFYHTQHAENIFLALQVINCHRKKFVFIEEKISCFGKKFLVIGRNFLSEVEMSFHRKKFLGIRINIWSEKEMSCFG